MAKKNRQDFHKKIRAKEAKIRNSNNFVDYTEEDARLLMEKYGITDYDFKFWGDIHIKSKYDNWIVSTDDDKTVIYLHHSTFQLDRKGNNRSSSHIQNVYYDLDFCLKSICEHDIYREEKNKI